MPVKHLNFTNRSRLTREHANIRIHPGQPASFDALLELSHLRDNAGEARVFVEAYHQTTRMRFDFGTVAAIVPPPPGDRCLHEFAEWKDVKFRIKVTDVTGSPGRILAWGNNIKPKGPDDQDQPDLVRFRDAELFGRLWDLKFDESGPIVLIEKSLGAQRVGRDDRFIAAAYPEILRRTLEQALIHDKAAVDDAEHWFKTWNDGYLSAKLHLRPVPPDAENAEDRRDWITEAVEAFGRHFSVAEYWTRATQQAGGN